MAWTWVDAAGVVHNTPVCYVDTTGAHRPALSDCLDYFTGGFQGIYGSDIVVGSDAQDGEFIGLLSSALNDANASSVMAYNAFSPATAQGTGLASVVKINGLSKKVPSFSTDEVTVVGQALTPIPAGNSFTDPAGNSWSIPATQIPLTGEINVIATCATLGAIAVAKGTVFTLQTFIDGWQTVTAFADASPGQPVEQDATLRQRQSVSSSQPAQFTLDAIVGAVLALPNVTACVGYDNDTATPDVNGIPGGCISLVVTGGDPNAIAGVIKKKAPGTPTYGTTTGTYTDAYGIARTVNFFVPTQTQIFWNVRLKPLAGYTVDVGASIQAALSNWTNALGDGGSVLINRANVPANLYGGAQSLTYEILSLQASIANGSFSVNDIAIPFNGTAACQVANVDIQTALT